MVFWGNGKELSIKDDCFHTFLPPVQPTFHIPLLCDFCVSWPLPLKTRRILRTYRQHLKHIIVWRKSELRFFSFICERDKLLWYIVRYLDIKPIKLIQIYPSSRSPMFTFMYFVNRRILNQLASTEYLSCIFFLLLLRSFSWRL